MKKYIIVCILIVFMMIFSSGCWNRREPEELAIVLATGFDYDEEKDLYEVIVQMANPVAMSSDQGGSSDNSYFWVVSAKGHTPYEATRNLMAKTSRALFFAHNRVVVFSEALACNGILPVLDYCDRERQLRLTARPMVVRGDIHKVMEAEFPLESSGAKGMTRQFLTALSEKISIPVMHISELYHTLPSPGEDVIIGVMEYIGDSEEKTKSPIKIEGGAVFRSDKLVGYLDDRAVQGWALSQSRALRSTLIILCPDHNEHPITVEVFSSKCEAKPIIEGENIRIELMLRAEGRIQDITCPIGYKFESLRSQSLNKRAAQVIKNDVERAIYIAQELGSDCMGFGNLIYRKLPKYWFEIEDQWREIFKELVVDVNVEMNIRRIGLVDKPVTPWSGG